MYILTKRKTCWHLPVKHRVVEQTHQTTLHATCSPLSLFHGRSLWWVRGRECWTEDETFMHRRQRAWLTPSSSPSPRWVLLSVQGRHGGTNVCESLLRCTVCTKPGKREDGYVPSPAACETRTVCAFAFMLERQVQTSHCVRFVLCTNSWLCQVSNREKNKDH